MLMVNFDADNNADQPGNDEFGVTISGMIDEFTANGTDRDWTAGPHRWDRNAADGDQPVGDNLDECWHGRPVSQSERDVVQNGDVTMGNRW